MNSMAYGIPAPSMLREAGEKVRLPRRFARVFTPSNIAAVALALVLLCCMAVTVVPYEIVNRSMVCKHCGGYEYSSRHTFGGLPVKDDRLFVANNASRLYDRFVTSAHKHEWILAGECRGRGNVFDQSELRIIRGSGSARSLQVEQSLMALAEGEQPAGAAAIPAGLGQ